MPTYTSSGPDGDVLLANAMPEAEYMYGCTPTSIAMILGYYDLYGYHGNDLSVLIEGDVDLKSRGTDGNIYNMNAFDTVLGRAIASEEFVYRFHSRNGKETTPKQELAYMFVSGTSTLNTSVWNCLADYIGTGQYWRGNDNLSTTITYCSLEKTYTYDSTVEFESGSTTKNVRYIDTTMLYGLDLYVQSRGYTMDYEITGSYLVDVAGGSFTFVDYMREIDAGRPVMISIQGHSMTGYGYNAETQEIIFDDCYKSGQRMKWNGKYKFGSTERKLQSITVIGINVNGSVDLALADVGQTTAKIIVAETKGAQSSSDYCFEGTALYLTYAVSNLGTDPGAGFDTSVRIDGELVSSCDVAPVVPGATDEFADVPLGELSVGLHNVCVIVDESNEIQELTGSNNAAEADILVLKTGTKILSETETVGRGVSLADTYVQGGAVLNLDGGAASGTVLRGADTDGRTFRASANVRQDGIMSGTVLYGFSELTVLHGGTLQDTRICSRGSATIRKGGSVTDTVVESGGRLVVSSGGKLAGRLQIASGASVMVSSGGIVDFDLTAATPGAEAFVNDLSRLRGQPLYTLTVSGMPESGTYRLADGAGSFSKTISLVNADNALSGTLEAGQTVSIGGFEYTLRLADGALSVEIVEKPDPVFFAGDFDGTGQATLTKEFRGSAILCQDGADGEILFTLSEGWSIAGTGDFNGDGRDDFLRVHNASGLLVAELSGGDGTFSPAMLELNKSGWEILGTGDFNGDGTDDVLEANPPEASGSGGLLGFRDGGTDMSIFAGYSDEWEYVSAGDFNGDGTDDMLWRRSFTGGDDAAVDRYCTWLLGVPEGSASWGTVGTVDPGKWDFLASGDFNGDGTDDLALISGEGAVGVWELEAGGLKAYSESEIGAGCSAWTLLGEIDSEAWRLAGVGDFNGDGTDDLAWYNKSLDSVAFWQIGDCQITART